MTDVLCENCGGKELLYVEDISCWRRVRGREDGKIVVDGYYETDGFDDGTNFRLMCRSCLHEQPVDLDAVEFVY